MEYNIRDISDDDFSLVENPGKEFYGVKLLKEWPGVIIVYGSVSLKEDLDNDTAKLAFNYIVEDPASYDKNGLEECVEFNNYLGAILQYILEDSLNNRTGKIGTDDRTEYTHIESPFEQ